MKNLVSIIIPHYKNHNLLIRALNSISKQKYKKYEIIVVNDNPKHKIKLEIKNYNKNFLKKIKVLNNKKNYGAGFSRNKGIALSKGEYIAFLDNDDIWNKNKLFKQISFMKKNNYSISHTSYRIIDGKKNYISCRNAKNLDYKNLLKSCDIGLSTVILKKKILNMKNPFPNLKTKEDYVLWLKISKLGNVFYGFNQKLTDWTDTPYSLSKSNIQKLIDAFRVYYVYEKFSFIKSLCNTFFLSLNYLKKK